jgi:hypothetical protein
MGMQFKIEPEELKHISTFEPQKSAEYLTNLVRRKLALCLGFDLVCEHKNAQLKKVGTVDDPQFESLTWKHYCDDCDRVVSPTTFK